MRDITELIKIIKKTVDSHQLENEGEYKRFLWQNEENNRKMGLNEYGCADAANILYTINEFPKDHKVREGFVKTLQSMQNPETGLFEENTHHFIHTTAHCTAALELFDALPLYKFRGFEKLKSPKTLEEFLENLNWAEHPWPESHKGAGIYAAMKLNNETDKEWEDTYFKWLWDNADPEFGFWKKGVIGNTSAKMYTYMGSGFHYMFNIEYAKMPIRYPEKIIDTCIDIFNNEDIKNGDGTYNIGFLEIDLIYCINRSLRQSGYRRDDCIGVMRKFAKEFIDWLYSLEHETHDGFNDLHMLFGTTCVLAELQTALPGEIITDKPLRLVLDRRPFI